MIEFEVYAQGATSNIPAIVYWILLTVFVVGFAVILSSQETQRAQKIARLMLMEWVVLMFCSAIIFRETRAGSAINLVPLSSYFCIAENSYLWEVTSVNILNVVMFLPVGFLLKLGYPQIGWKQVLILGLVFSASIELSQFVFKRGLCEIDDLIHNVVGCMIGYGLMAVTQLLNAKSKL